MNLDDARLALAAVFQAESQADFMASVAAFDRLFEVNTPVAVFDLASCLAAGETEDRLIAAWTLAEVHERGQVAGVGARVSDLLSREADPAVVEPLLIALGSVGSPDHVDQVLEQVNSENPSIRFAVGEALPGFFPHPQAIAGLIALSTDDDPEVRLSAVAGLGLLLHAEDHASIHERVTKIAADDDDPEVRAAAAQTLVAAPMARVPARRYIGFIRIADRPPIRLSVTANSRAEALAQVVAEHGDGHSISLFDEDDTTHRR